MIKKKGKKIKCMLCGYEWNTRSIRSFVCCPNCMRKVYVKENAVFRQNIINHKGGKN
jgi:hypothetical protein